MSRRMGFSYYLDVQHLMEDLASFGTVRRPWNRLKVNDEAEIFGYYEWNEFDPEDWRGGYPNPTFQRTTPRDALWMVRIMSNFTDEHLTTVIDLTFVTPAVNQIELHPLLNQEALRKTNAEHNVLTQSYTPLALGKLNDNPTVNSVAGEYGKTASQVLLRWNLQLGNAVVFRSANAEHIASNLDVFDFELADEHMDAINALNDGTRLRPDPETYEGS